MVPGQQQEMGIRTNRRAYGISSMEKKKDTTLWCLRVTDALYSTLINDYSIPSKVLLSIFPFDEFLTVAYTTMIYNEYHRKSTGISWTSGISSQKKKKRKNEQTCETWSLTIMLLLKLEAVWFCLLEQHRGTSAGSDDVVENSSKNKHLYANKEPKPTKWIPSR